jgi:hypothetical protein
VSAEEFFLIAFATAAAACTAYFKPDILPGCKGMALRVGPLKMLLVICGVSFSSLILITIIYALHLDVVRYVVRFIYMIFYFIIFDNYPEDKWRSSFSSDKVKALVAKVAAIHNVPKPSVA